MKKISINFDLVGARMHFFLVCKVSFWCEKSMHRSFRWHHTTSRLGRLGVTQYNEQNNQHITTLCESQPTL